MDHDTPLVPLTLQVPADVAMAWERLTPTEQADLQQRLGAWLKDALVLYGPITPEEIQRVHRDLGMHN